VNNLGAHAAMATTKWQDHERTIAATERRRQAKVALLAAGTSDHTVTARLPRVSAIGIVTNMRRTLRRGLVNLVVRRQPA